MQEREYKFTLTEENKSKVEQFLKLLNIDADIVEAENTLEEQSKEKEWPQDRDVYYYVASMGSVESLQWTDCPVDRQMAQIGNCFKTKEEAKFEVERLKVLAEMKKFAEPEDRKWDSCNEHYYPYYSFERDNIEYQCKFECKSNGIYFESEEKVKECVKAVGEDRIKKYYLRIKE